MSRRHCFPRVVYHLGSYNHFTTLLYKFLSLEHCSLIETFHWRIIAPKSPILCMMSSYGSLCLLLSADRGSFSNEGWVREISFLQWSVTTQCKLAAQEYFSNTNRTPFMLMCFLFVLVIFVVLMFLFLFYLHWVLFLVLFYFIFFLLFIWERKKMKLSELEYGKELEMRWQRRTKMIKVYHMKELKKTLKVILCSYKNI